jgi:hypothetical protein
MGKSDFGTVDRAIAGSLEDGEERGKVWIEDDGFNRVLANVSRGSKGAGFRGITLRTSIFYGGQPCIVREREHDAVETVRTSLREVTWIAEC